MKDLAKAEERSFVLRLESTSPSTQASLVVMRLGETPVPIPNTMVKPQTADGTALETVWESRWPPAPKKKNVICDMRFEENFRFHMTDKKSVRSVDTTPRSQAARSRAGTQTNQFKTVL